MLKMTTMKSNMSDSVEYHNSGPTMIFACLRTLCNVTVRYRLTHVVVKAMHTASTHNDLPEISHSDV